MLKRINPVLPELIAGIVIYGMIVQLTGMWFVSDKQQYTMGLWIGILLAIGMAVNMAIVILDAVDGMASAGNRSEERRVGKDCFITCRSRW